MYNINKHNNENINNVQFDLIMVDIQTKGENKKMKNNLLNFCIF